MAKYTIYTTRQFNKDYDELSKQEQRLTDEVIDKLASGEKLEAKYNDHPLKGNLKGFRDCHIKFDLVLIYEIDKSVLILTAVRVGKHAKVLKL